MIKSLTDREYQKFKELTDSSPAVKVFSMNQLVPEEFDAIALTYSGSELITIKYYTGGTSGTVVATLTLTWSGGKLATVSKS